MRMLDPNFVDRFSAGEFGYNKMDQIISTEKLRKSIGHKKCLVYLL